MLFSKYYIVKFKQKFKIFIKLDTEITLKTTILF
jgi:hypothetical protein